MYLRGGCAGVTPALYPIGVKNLCGAFLSFEMSQFDALLNESWRYIARAAQPSNRQMSLADMALSREPLDLWPLGRLASLPTWDAPVPPVPELKPVAFEPARAAPKPAAKPKLQLSCSRWHVAER